jgi:hypothetical protein
LNIYAVPVNPASSQLWLAEIFLVLSNYVFRQLFVLLKL